MEPKKIKFSIVIALAPWRDAEILPFIKKQDFPRKNYEIIIEKGLNVPINRNKGVKRAKGDIIIFLDDDGIIERDYLKKVDSFMSEHPEISILGGPQLTPETDGFFARTSGYALSHFFASGKAGKRYKKSNLSLNADSDYLTGANLICRRKVFKSVKFDPLVYPSDDVNFVEESKNLGFKVGYSPEIIIFHRRRKKFTELQKQIFDYARTRPRKNSFLNIIKKPAFLVPSLFIIYLLLLPTLFLINKFFILPLFIYVFLNVLFSFYQSIKYVEFFSFFVLIFLFFAIHLIYGLGFIVGMCERVLPQKQNEK